MVEAPVAEAAEISHERLFAPAMAKASHGQIDAASFYQVCVLW